MNNTQIGCCSPVERKRSSEANNPEIEVKMLNVIRSLFRENSRFVRKINVDSICVPHSSILGKNWKITLINKMKSSCWHSTAVDGLLNFLVRDTKDFSLLIFFCEDEPSNNNDSDLFWDFHFTWSETGFRCIVKESENGYDFNKDLVLVEQPTKTDYYVRSEKRKDLCIVMVGEQILLQPWHPDSFITVWEYYGNENDAHSRHRSSPGILTVFGFKLKSIDSDVTKCLGAADCNRVGLMHPSIPEHGSVIKTKEDKPDNRFFYHNTANHGCSMFESTQFENHFLAMKDSDQESVSPYLYLKEIAKDKEYDEEIMFKMSKK